MRDQPIKRPNKNNPGQHGKSNFTYAPTARLTELKVTKVLLCCSKRAVYEQKPSNLNELNYIVKKSQPEFVMIMISFLIPVLIPELWVSPDSAGDTSVLLQKFLCFSINI